VNGFSLTPQERKVAMFAAACLLIGLTVYGFRAVRGTSKENVRETRKAQTREIRARLDRVDRVNGAHHRPRGILDLNLASEKDLARLPSLGPALAHSVVMYRSAHGPFARLSDLDQVKELGAERIREVSRFLYVLPPHHYAGTGSEPSSTPETNP
jgi:competence protein ComEA